MIKVYRLNLLSAMGSLTAAMTNPPALAVASNQTETDLPALSYASTYPVALIFKILLAQVLLEILRHLL
jgi:putative transport protein